NRLWPYFAGSLVLVLGSITLYEHLPYNLDSVEKNGVFNAVLLSMVASFIGLAGLENPLYSYSFFFSRTPVASKNVETPADTSQTSQPSIKKEAETNIPQKEGEAAQAPSH
ncbi:MAG: hypothetical protein OXB86_04200, partial [Bdellovibrionales bacterium]|nr:hypothetical protein [Bdellovibrionales bacterium]